MATLLPRFAAKISAASVSDISLDPSLGGALTIETQGSLSVVYAPFDYVNTAAKVVLIGITPGRQQAVNAMLEARRQLVLGNSLDVASKAAKELASFSGSMRSSLVGMLDHIKLAPKLGLASCSALFGAGAGLVHYTSALRYPVYVDGQNYSGNPSIARHPMLARQVGEHLAEEARLLPDAVWIPLGPAPTLALGMLANQGVIQSSRILAGLPHPSGANAERIAYFLGRKPAANLSAKTNATTIDAARTQLCNLVAGLAMPSPKTV